ncbi:MAG: aminopeptidase P family protein [Candidatus Lokiarchaeota archaeon]|nr:aminopeptidase P family protein [Candidatus Lokiarchaeota archaeon]
MISEADYTKRLKNLQIQMKVHNLDAFLVTEPHSIYYLTGASYEAQERPFFIIIWSMGSPTFLVPKLEEEHMRKAKIGDVKSYWEFPAPRGEGWGEKLYDILKPGNEVGIEPGMRIEMQQLLSKYNLKAIDMVGGLRLIKSSNELKMIRNTAHHSDELMRLIMTNSYYGVSVLELFGLSRKIQLKLIKSGKYDPLASSFLSANWPAPHSAKPHSIPPVYGVLKKGPCVAMSYLRINGYAAECERTFFVSKPTPKEKVIFNDMLSARQIALSMLRPGVSCHDVDKATYDFLVEKGYNHNILHRTGHGIGQDNHEGPYLARGSKTELEENMVVSIEPGIYMPELGGFRHSDTVLITSSGYELLTNFPTDLKSLTILSKKLAKQVKGKLIQTAMGIKK